MHDPSKVHWQVIRRILWYILGTVDVGLKFEKSNRVDRFVFGYVDSDYACDLDKRRSTIAYGFTMAGTVAISTMQAEYIAVTETIKEAIWLHRLVADLGIGQQHVAVFLYPECYTVG